MGPGGGLMGPGGGGGMGGGMGQRGGLGGAGGGGGGGGGGSSYVYGEGEGIGQPTYEEIYNNQPGEEKMCLVCTLTGITISVFLINLLDLSLMQNI